LVRLDGSFGYTTSLLGLRRVHHQELTCVDPEATLSSGQVRAATQRPAPVANDRSQSSPGSGG